MNEWVLAGLVVVGSIIALGGGSWLMKSIFSKKDKDTKA